MEKGSLAHTTNASEVGQTAKKTRAWGADHRRRNEDKLACVFWADPAKRWWFRSKGDTSFLEYDFFTTWEEGHAKLSV